LRQNRAKRVLPFLPKELRGTESPLLDEIESAQASRCLPAALTAKAVQCLLALREGTVGLIRRLLCGTGTRNANAAIAAGADVRGPLAVLRLAMATLGLCLRHPRDPDQWLRTTRPHSSGSVAGLWGGGSSLKWARSRMFFCTATAPNRLRRKDIA
jgi:hypothetical protein